MIKQLYIDSIRARSLRSDIIYTANYTFKNCSEHGFKGDDRLKEKFRNSFLLYSNLESAQEASNWIINYFNTNKDKFSCIGEEPNEGALVFVAYWSKQGKFSPIIYSKSSAEMKILWQRHLLFKTKELAENACIETLKAFSKLFKDEETQYFSFYLEAGADYTLPKPDRDDIYFTPFPAPEKGEEMYVPAVHNPDGFIRLIYDPANTLHNTLISLGLCFHDSNSASDLRSFISNLNLYGDDTNCSCCSCCSCWDCC